MPNFKIIKDDKKTQSIDDLPVHLSWEYRNKMGRLLKLSKTQEKKLKKRIKKEIESYETDTSQLMQDLMDDFDLIEGNVEETDFPWEGSSQVDTGITQMYEDAYYSTERRSLLGADTIWMMEVKPGNDQLQEQRNAIEQAINYYATNEWNIVKGMKQALRITNRDGVCPVEVDYVEDYEKTKDFVLVHNTDDFYEEFPSAEESGMSEAAYRKLLRKVQLKATTEEPVKIAIEYEKPEYVGPKLNPLDYAEFLIFPASACEISEARGWGKKYTLRKGEVRQKMDDKLWYKDACKDFLKWARGEAKIPEYKANRLMVAGLNQSDKSDDHVFYRLVYKCRLDGKEVMKLLVEYHKDSDSLMSCIAYPYRVNNYAFVRIKIKPKQLRGESIPDNTRESHYENNALHRQRGDSRTINNVPTFKAPLSIKKDFDPSDERNQWRPGNWFFFPDDAMKDVGPMSGGNRDLGETLQEEQHNMNLLDLRMGSAIHAVSGIADPNNPDAPGNKTAMLIGQSNMRMDNPISELGEGLSEIGDICISMFYQFGPNQIPYKVKEMDQGREVETTKELSKRYLRYGLRAKMKNVSVRLNPEGEFWQGVQRHKFLLQEPVFASNDDVRYNHVQKVLRDGRITDWEQILPSMQQVKQRQLQMQMQAMKMLQAEQELEEREIAETREQAVMKDAEKEFKLKKLAEQRASQGSMSGGARGQ